MHGPLPFGTRPVFPAHPLLRYAAPERGHGPRNRQAGHAGGFSVGTTAPALVHSPYMYETSWHERISEIPREEWNGLTVCTRNPLLDWEWLNRMEVCGSIAPRTGWYPCHLAVRDPENGDRLIAAVPLYGKTHSMGEFVFDFAWADVAQQLGVPYYPKLVGTVPATPAVGYRFLIDPAYESQELVTFMVEQIHDYAQSNGYHGTSFLFLDPAFKPYLDQLGFVGWMHQSFEWQNEGFETFDDYLARFNKNQRKNIRKECRSMEEKGIEMRCHTGEDIQEEHLVFMFDFYENTNDQFGPFAARFLNRDFFLGLPEDFRHRLLLVGGYPRGSADPIGMSLLAYKDDRMIGRYWGTNRYVDNLHFNACYYVPIRWAIEHGIRDFDPGMGSSHKVRRGFKAVSNHSMHYFYDKRMHIVMDQNIEKINSYERHNIQALNRRLPFAQREN